MFQIRRGFALRTSMESELDRIERRLSDSRLTRPHDAADFEKMSLDLAGPPFPEGVGYLYHWFCSIAAGRSSNGFGPNRISSVEINAWSQLAGHRLTPWEFEMIQLLDQRWLTVYAELHRPDEKPQK